MNTFLLAGGTLAAMGNTYEGIEFGKRVKLALVYKTGSILGNNIACRLPDSYLFSLSMAKSVELSHRINARFVESCAHYFSTSQCECLVNVGQAVSPDIRRYSYSRDMIPQLIRRNPLIGLAIVAQCGIVNY